MTRRGEIWNVLSRRSTPVSTVLRESVRFFIINIFSIKKASKLKSRDEIIRQFSSLHLRRMELANILSHMIQKPRKGDFREIKSKKFPGGACPQTSLEACTFTTHLENWSVFTLDWCLVFLNPLCWVPF